VGDLRKLIASAQGAKQWEQTKGEAGDMVKDAIVDEILGKIPGASAAKSLFGFVKASYELPDESRTGTALDALDVDDPVAEIVDDPIENKFLKVFSKELEDMDGNTPISNLNMTELLSKFIAKHFDARTVTGFTEGAPKMKITRRQLRRIIKEEKAKILRESIPGEESPKLRQAAADLGSLMAGQPPTAYAVADALKGRYPGAAKDLLAAYNKAQAWIDLEYMD